MLWELKHFFQCQYHMYFSSLFSFNGLSVAMKCCVIIYNNRKPRCNADFVHTLHPQGQTDLTYQSFWDGSVTDKDRWVVLFVKVDTSVVFTVGLCIPVWLKKWPGKRSINTNLTGDISMIWSLWTGITEERSVLSWVNVTENVGVVNLTCVLLWHNIWKTTNCCA